MKKLMPFAAMLLAASLSAGVSFAQDQPPGMNMQMHGSQPPAGGLHHKVRAGLAQCLENQRGRHVHAGLVTTPVFLGARGEFAGDDPLAGIDRIDAVDQVKAQD